ncbi:FtsX-like permease family protein [Luedemannella flava]
MAVAPGATVNLRAIEFEPSPGSGPPTRVPGGGPRPMSVVGIYHPADPAAGFWGLDVLDTPLDPAELPILTNLRTLSALPHQQEQRSIVAEPLPGTITADRMDQLSADLDRTLTGRDGIVPSSGLTRLLATFRADLQTMKVAPTFAAGALVVLCWFVIFVAMAHTTEARRAELGLLKLRGASGADQAWLALAENVVALTAGGFVGYLVGHAAIWLVARTLLPVPVAVPVTLSPLPYAAVTLIGAIGAGVLALRRDLMSPALELMRRVPSRLGRTQGVLVAIVVTALAAASVAQLNANPGDLGGLGVLAPGLVVLAGGPLLSRLLDPVVGWLGRRALRRGRLASALASLHFARRGSGGRALALLVVAVGLFGYAVIAADTADRVRTREARQSIAADRAVSVGAVLPDRLIRAVRQVDPEGRYAMAVVVRPDGQRGDVLAVDSVRLPAVAFWPDGAPVAVGSVPARLRPPVAPVVTVTGTSLVLRATASLTPGRVLAIRVWVAPTNGEPATSVAFGSIRPGSADYRVDVPCAQGCRLGNLSLQQRVIINDGSVGTTTSLGSTVVLNSLRQGGPDQELVSAAGFGGWSERSLGALS